jgi:N-acetyl-S-(2-succino)cysteine monooxygenase
LLKSLINPAAAKAMLSSMIEQDLSNVAPNTPASEILESKLVSGMQGHVDALAAIARTEGLTIAELAVRLAHSLTFARFAGTPEQVADQLEAWFHADAGDGFIIRPSYLPGSMEEFVRLVVPELQRRGLFRKEYRGSTLRDHLGLSRPAHGSWKRRFNSRVEAPQEPAASLVTA